MKSRCTTTPKGVFGLLVMMLVLATSAFATDYYVATDGSDNDPGTIAEPFATIQHAADVMSAGDTCYIRAGTYHESVSWTTGSLTGTEANPVTFTNYQNEEVILDGTEAITGTWTQHSGNIYKISYSTDIWQLFDDGEMMISARWPNATWAQNWEQDLYWGQCTSQSSNGHLYDSPHDGIDLADENLSFTNGVAILNLGNWKTWARTVNNHTAGDDDFTYTAVDLYKDESKHRYFLECKLNMLDAEKEWYYDSSGNMLYLWAPGGGSPSGTIKGKTQSFAFDVEGCDYIVLDGLNFFATTFKFLETENCAVKNCDLNYASYSKRMLGNTGDPDVTTVLMSDKFDPSNFTLYNCSITYTDGPAVWMSGRDNLIENCYFQDIDYSVVNVSNNGFAIQTIASAGITYKRNTLKTAGASEGFRGGNSFDALYPMLVEYNYHYNCGLLQSDGATFQLGANSGDNCEARYNWSHHSPKYGIRLDGTVEKEVYSTSALVHHNVVWDLENCGLRIKGDYQETYNNIAYECDFVDIPIWDEDGIANDHSITRNNAGDEISGDKIDPETNIPGTDSNNWTGYVKGELRNGNNMDFRPTSTSDLKDAGYVISGITDGYLGTAPDIGAYEYGCTNYWIPGRKEEKASMPVPRDAGWSVPTDADLMWLEGLDETSSNVYFGTASGSLTYQANQTNNIYDPGTLSSDTTYYWRIDTVTASDTITGDEWSFYTGAGGAGEGSDTFNSTDDTMVNKGSPSTNYGDLNVMRIQGIDKYLGYVKFNVSSVGGTVTTALLKMKSWTSSINDTSIYKVTGDWDESTLTWNNDDLVWGTLQETKTSIAASTWYSFDVSNSVTGNGTYSFGIKTTQDASGKKWWAKESGDTPAIFVSWGTDTTPPAAPTGLSATGGSGQITLDWNDNTESDLDGYNVYRTDDPVQEYSKINESLLSTSAYTDTSVSNNTTYYYVVRAVDTSSNESQSSTGDWAVPQLDTTPPAAPTNLVATPEPNQVSLDWDDNTEGDLDGYNVYRSLTSGSGFSKINGSLVSASAYTDNTVNNDTTYYYKVTAVDASSNESGYSNEASAVPAGWTQLTYDDFESGWGNYTSGGVDAKLYTAGTYAHQGTACADLEDDTGVTASFYHTNGIDVDTAGYTQIQVEFWFKTISFDNDKEDFWVQYYDGTDWNTVEDYVYTVDFQNGIFYDKTGANAVYINEGTGEGEYTFPTDMKIRFMCDASGGADDAYIDEIRVSAK